MALVGVEIESEASGGKMPAAAQIFEAGERVAEGENCLGIAGQAEALMQALLAQLAGILIGVGGGEIDGSVSGAVAVVIDHQGALAAVAVGIGKDVFVHLAGALEEVVEQEIGALGEEPAALEERSDFTFVAFNEPLLGVSS